MTQDVNNRATHQEQCISRGVHTDRQARILSANEQFSTAVGINAADLSGKPLNNIFHGDVPTAVLAEILHAIRSGKVWSGILEMIGDSDSPWWSRVTVAPVAGHSDNYLWTFAEANAADIDAAKSYYKQLRSGKKSLKKGYIAKLYKKMVDLPIGLKIAGFATLLTTALAVILTVTGLSTIHSILDDSEQQALAEYSHGLDTMIEGMGDEAAALASLVAALPETREALKNRDRAVLESRFREAFEILEKEFSIRQFQFHLPPAKSLLRVHKPEKWGDDLSGFRHTVVTANTEARTVVGVEKGKAGYGIRGVVPIIEEGKVLGSVEFGTSLASSFFKNFEKEYGVDAAFYSVEGDKLVPVGATIDLKTLLTPKEVSLLLEDGTLLKNQEIDGKHYGVMFRPLKDYSGKPVGIIGIARDRSLYVEKMSSLFVEKVTLSLIIILTTIFLAYWIARNISRPVQQAAEVAENISQGIYNNPIDARSEDETGKLLAAMAGMQATLGYNLHEARESAEENARIKTALDYIATNVTVSNADGELIFMNESCIRLFNQLATSHGERSDFDATSLVGTRLLDFFSDEGLRAIYARQLSEREVVEYELWDHQFKLTISPVRDEQGTYVARVTQWDDITDERNIGKEIQQIVDAAQNGDLSVQIGLEEKQGFYRDLSTGVNKMTAVIGQVIDDIATAMHRVASGDLTAPIETEYRGVYGQVRESVNETIASLRKMVADLSATSQQISSSSSEIQSGNDELSQRTEQQASNLETTVASMEEITGTVKQNAENAQESTALASEARDISLRGVDVVKNAIGAMESISESSTRIEEIIHVIDDIAFQTNLLALNAAVEAARAGEQGRGFAVVATEVRDLAGRSSEAAKQIKQLISDSVERVERGTSLVNEVGTTLDAINGSISQVNDIMAEIAHANHEQSVGIDQVNRAITQIDEVTQQNTALAEQTAAVAISLKQQSVELEKMIARFKLVPENDAAVSGHYLRAV